MVHMDSDDLTMQLEALTRDELDSLNLGVIRLDASGNVTYFSATEARQSGFAEDKAIGRDFFTHVAPCMAAHDFRARLDEAGSTGKLDIRFENIGDFGDAGRQLRVRVKSATHGGFWLVIERLP